MIISTRSNCDGNPVMSPPRLIEEPQHSIPTLSHCRSLGQCSAVTNWRQLAASQYQSTQHTQYVPRYYHDPREGRRCIHITGQKTCAVI